MAWFQGFYRTPQKFDSDSETESETPFKIESDSETETSPEPRDSVFRVRDERLGKFWYVDRFQITTYDENQLD